MPAHVACRPSFHRGDPDAGCSVVCAEHELRWSFGSAHSVAHAACVEHNVIHHPRARRRTARLLSLIYESRSTAELAPEALEDLLTRARMRNRAFGVTGMLLVEHGWFLQALEGPEPIVEHLMRTIAHDRRHGHVRVIAREHRQERRFPDWAMAEGHIGDIEARPLEQYYEALLMSRGRSTTG